MVYKHTLQSTYCATLGIFSFPSRLKIYLISPKYTYYNYANIFKKIILNSTFTICNTTDSTMMFYNLKLEPPILTNYL